MPCESVNTSSTRPSGQMREVDLLLASRTCWTVYWWMLRRRLLSKRRQLDDPLGSGWVVVEGPRQGHYRRALAGVI